MRIKSPDKLVVDSVDELNAEAAALAKWHVWFAWYPVTLDDGTWVWLEHVQRSVPWLTKWVHLANTQRQVGASIPQWHRARYRNIEETSPKVSK